MLNYSEIIREMERGGPEAFAELARMFSMQALSEGSLIGSDKANRLFALVEESTPIKVMENVIDVLALAEDENLAVRFMKILSISVADSGQAVTKGLLSIFRRSESESVRAEIINMTYDILFDQEVFIRDATALTEIVFSGTGEDTHKSVCDVALYASAQLENLSNSTKVLVAMSRHTEYAKRVLDLICQLSRSKDIANGDQELTEIIVDAMLECDSLPDQADLIHGMLECYSDSENGTTDMLVRNLLRAACKLEKTNEKLTNYLVGMANNIHGMGPSEMRAYKDILGAIGTTSKKDLDRILWIDHSEKEKLFLRYAVLNDCCNNLNVEYLVEATRISSDKQHRLMLLKAIYHSGQKPDKAQAYSLISSSRGSRSNEVGSAVIKCLENCKTTDVIDYMLAVCPAGGEVSDQALASLRTFLPDRKEHIGHHMTELVRREWFTTSYIDEFVSLLPDCQDTENALKALRIQIFNPCLELKRVHFVVSVLAKLRPSWIPSLYKAIPNNFLTAFANAMIHLSALSFEIAETLIDLYNKDISRSFVSMAMSNTHAIYKRPIYGKTKYMGYEIEIKDGKLEYSMVNESSPDDIIKDFLVGRVEELSLQGLPEWESLIFSLQSVSLSDTFEYFKAYSCILPESQRCHLIRCLNIGLGKKLNCN